jgi:hypothetical protein
MPITEHDNEREMATEGAEQIYEPLLPEEPWGTVGVVVARMDLDGREYGPHEPVPCDEADVLLKLRFLNGRRPGMEMWSRAVISRPGDQRAEGLRPLPGSRQSPPHGEPARKR